MRSWPDSSSPFSPSSIRLWTITNQNGRWITAWLGTVLVSLWSFPLLFGFRERELCRHLVTLQNNSYYISNKWSGMGYRPTHADPDVTVISFNAKDPKYWSDRVDDFLGRKWLISHSNWWKVNTFILAAYYTIAPKADAYAECNYGTANADPITPCSFKVDLNKCAQNDYGFGVNKPCLFLKPNKVWYMFDRSLYCRKS